MKPNEMTSKITIIFIIFALLPTLSCNKSEQYSCDEQVKQWVLENFKDLQDITRSELANYPLNYQKAIYRALDNEKKSEIWNEKLDSIRTAQWPSSFNDILDTMETLLRPSFFDNDNLEIARQYCDLWMDTLLNIHGIDSTIVFICFLTTSTMSELQKTIYQAQPSNDCDCKWSISCRLLNEGFCVKEFNNCDETSYGCGFLYFSPCTGQCDEAIVEPD